MAGGPDTLGKGIVRPKRGGYLVEYFTSKEFFRCDKITSNVGWLINVWMCIYTQGAAPAPRLVSGLLLQSFVGSVLLAAVVSNFQQLGGISYCSYIECVIGNYFSE